MNRTKLIRIARIILRDRKILSKSYLVYFFLTAKSYLVGCINLCAGLNLIGLGCVISLFKIIIIIINNNSNNRIPKCGP